MTDCPCPPVIEHHERTATLEGRFYVVKYAVARDGVFTVPATVGGKPHYGATVEVYRIVDAEPVAVGKPFPGTWVDGGCYEDAPEALIKQAVEAAANP